MLKLYNQKGGYMADEKERLRLENKSLRDRISLLEEQNLQLRQQVSSLLLPAEWEPPDEFKLTKFESIVLKTLYKSDRVVSRQHFLDSLYINRPAADLPTGNLVDVWTNYRLG